MKITKNNIQDVFKSKKSTVETLELKGYKLLKELFFDNSGLASEKYLSDGSLQELENILKDNPQVYTFITGYGQFQLYIGIFIKVKKEFKSRIIGNNTIEYFQENKRKIRFHHTDILEFSENGESVKIFNGGYFTSTTKKRINNHIKGFHIYQKSGKWYITKLDNEGNYIANSKTNAFDFSKGITLMLN